MSDLLLHAQTQADIAAFQQEPAHALVLSGPAGSGKLSIAVKLGEQLLALEPGALETHAYARIISPTDGKAIGIEAVRELEHFLSLKVPRQGAVNRIVIIADSHSLTTEAQNALLKTIEEPPAGTILILTVAHEQALLPTIRSRVQHIAVKRPDATALRDYATEQGHQEAAIKRAIAMGGGLPGLTLALLNESDHPLLPATERARTLLGQSVFERLVHVDELAQDRALCLDVLFIMQQMARMSLRTATTTTARRWQAVLANAYETQRAIAGGAQLKLALCSFFLSI